MARRHKHKVDWGPKGALSIPKALMDHPDFKQLSPSAMKVLMILGYQYNGHNNGDLSATYLMMKPWGGMAKATLANALKELQQRNLIIKTRTNYKGREGARCALYGLTLAPVDV